MDTSILVAMISTVGGLCGAAATYLLAKRAQRDAAARARKVRHYQKLLAAISDVAVDSSDAAAHRRFAREINTIALVSPQSVVDAVMAFHDGVKATNPARSPELHDRLLVKLLLAIRIDLRIQPADDVRSFHFHLAGAPKRPASSDH